MRAIKTLEDLERERQKNPGYVAEVFEQVEILPDLFKYLDWLSGVEGVTKLNFKLSRKKTRALGIHPSSACKKGVCLLKLYYECTGDILPEPNIEEATQLTWDIGTFLHEIHQAYFKDMYGDQFSAEVPLKIPQYLVKSRTDGRFDFSVNRIILEMKSIKEGGNFGFAKVQDAPFEDNVRQAHFYMKASNVPFAILLYICKNNSERKEHRIMFDPDLWRSMENDVVIPVVDSVIAKAPPEGYPGWHCRWCAFEYACPTKRAHKKKGAKKNAKRNRAWTPR